MRKGDKLTETSSGTLLRTRNILIVLDDIFAIVGIALVSIVVEVDTHNFTAQRIQILNVTVSVIRRELVSHGDPLSLRPVMGARRQTFTHKQRMPTRQGGIDKDAFRTPFVGHFVDYKQCHCRLALRYSQSEAGIIREESTRDFAVSNDANNHGNRS